MSDCNVCIGGGDYDGSPEFHDVTYPKSRKEHKCIECHRVIAKGSAYERSSGKFDGVFFSDCACMDCVNIRNGLACGESVAYGNLWQEIADCEVFQRFTTGCLDKIETASAKSYFLERWRKWKGLVV